MKFQSRVSSFQKVGDDYDDDDDDLQNYSNDDLNTDKF